MVTSAATFRRARASRGDIDVVLIDLIDERGGVIPLGGGYVTKLSEMWGAGGREIAAAGLPLLEFGTDPHFTAWSAAFGPSSSSFNRLGIRSRTARAEDTVGEARTRRHPIPIPTG